jgi:F420H(2)-dependent quinone reductase
MVVGFIGHDASLTPASRRATTAKKYQMTSIQRFANRTFGMLIRLGVAPKGMHVLTVRGRKSGKRYSTPVTLLEEGTSRWLVTNGAR